jgi:alpha-1,6-mannosyltransferase
MPEIKARQSFAYILMAILMLVMGYYIEREQSIALLSVFIVLVGAMIYILKTTEEEEVDLPYYWAILLRLLLVFSIPMLSDDVYRFIWDGRLTTQLVDPYKHLPIAYLSQGIEGITPDLFLKLNSPEYFSIYPPLNQVFFFLSALLSPDSEFWSIVVLRVIIFTFELGNISLIRKLLRHYKLPQRYGLFYALNPMVILELTGNLHFEGIMVYFLLLALWYFEQNKLHWSAVFFGFSVATKFLPLIFLPLLIRKIGFKKTMLYGLIVAGILVISFLPLINTAHIWAIQDSLALYFQKFEFNGSLYYLTRWYGFETEGHNIIAKSGQWMIIATLISITFYSLLPTKKSLPTKMVWVWSLYLLFATTVHPWYVIPLLAFSVFTEKRFAFVWSFLIFLTYANYMSGEYFEWIEIVIAEYAIVGIFALYESTGRSLQKWFF